MTLPKRTLHLAFWTNLGINVFATLLGLAKTGNPSRYFGEGRFTTAISCFQLLLCAFFAFRIFEARRNTSEQSGFRAPYWVWPLMGCGFVFLAMDDAFQFHEKMDKVLNHLFHLPKNGITDRIDDAIIGVYGLIGIWVLWIYRRELLNFRVMLRPLIIGFVFMFISVICDTTSNREDLLMWLTNNNLALSKKLDGWFSVGDGAFTLFAEGMFAAAYFLGWKRALPETAADLALSAEAAASQT